MNRKFPDPTSLTLLERMKAGDELAWERFVLLYGEPTIRVYRRLEVPSSDIDDLVQIVFSRLGEKIVNFERERTGSFRKWLKGFIHHVYRESVRQRIRSPSPRDDLDQLAPQADDSRDRNRIAETEIPVSVDESPTADEIDAIFCSEIFRIVLRKVKGEVEAHTFAAFFKTVIEEKPAKQAAEEIENELHATMTPGGVRVAKARVLARIRKHLEDYSDFDLFKSDSS